MLDPGGPQVEASHLHGVRLIEENADRSGRGEEGGHQELAAAAAHVDDLAGGRPVHGPDEISADQTGQLDHRAMERRRRFGVGLQILEAGGGRNEGPGALPGRHAVQEMPPDRPRAAPPVKHPGAQGIRGAAIEQGAHRGQLERSVLALANDLDRRQGAQEPPERRLASAARRGELGGGAWGFGQAIGDLEPGGDVHRLGLPAPRDEAEEPGRVGDAIGTGVHAAA